MDITHVKELEDTEILALVDRHVFGQSLWCNGQSQYDAGQRQRLCTICGQIDEGSLAELIGYRGRHPRRVPAYSTQMIIQAMRGKTIGASARFELLLLQTDRHNVRCVAIAALRALGVIDRSGHLH